MARRTKTRRSKQKVLDAFQIAERAENGESESESGSDDDLEVHDGIMNAAKFLPKDQEPDFDDEELLSDEALGSDDDYDVLNSKFSQTLRDKKKKKLQESDEEYDSIDESELVPLSVAWDMADGKDIQLQSESEESEDESEEESESESDSESDSEIFDENDDNVNLTNTMLRLLSQIQKPKEHKRLVTEATEENEYNVPSSGKLSMNEMLAAVDSSVSKDAILIDEEAKALDAPLPQSIQARNNRKVAYEITKEELNKWQETIEKNMDAEHLVFPMNAPSQPKQARPFHEESEPGSELEKRIQTLLEQSALHDEKNEATFEEIAVAKMSKEDLRKRTNELRLMRELMFRDERKAKRLKKIKSKQFRKIKKKERLRDQQLVEGSDESDAETHDMKRAEERMSLKHKTKNKWAQSMIKSGLSKDADNRAELEEMLRQGERLRAKQLGYQDGDQSDDGVSDIEREYEREETSRDDVDAKKSALGKGVLGMDFMKAAEERQRQENRLEMERIRKLRAGEDEEYENENTTVNVEKNEGRRIYTPASVSMKPEMDEVNKKTLEQIEEDNERGFDKKVRKLNNQIEIREENSEDEKDGVEVDTEDKSPASELNPWLTDDVSHKKKAVYQVDETSSKFSKSAAKIDKVAKKRTASQRARDEDQAIINITETLHMNGDVHGSDTEDSDSGDVRMFKQKNLIKEAFAGDDVVTEFANEKRQIVEDEGDKEEDITLPGWGAWAGEGAPQRKKKFIRKIDGVVQQDKRRDKDLKDVIINETVNKKNLKYQSAAVPYPFESREQYERSLRMPIGEQWTSRETHQKLTKPRIIKQQGRVIDPLKAPFRSE